MKLNKLIGSFFIFAASLTIIGLFGATASFAQNKENIKKKSAVSGIRHSLRTATDLNFISSLKLMMQDGYVSVI
jgi:hypothetical protein